MTHFQWCGLLVLIFIIFLNKTLEMTSPHATVCVLHANRFAPI
jgi:hypothetical protein